MVLREKKGGGGNAKFFLLGFKSREGRGAQTTRDHPGKKRGGGETFGGHVRRKVKVGV